MKLFPASAHLQLEFDKVKALLFAHCRSDYAKNKADGLEVYTEKNIIDGELRQSHEWRQLLQNNIYFPNDFVLNLSRDLKLLNIPGAIMSGEQLISFRKLATSIEKIFRWFDEERKTAFVD